MNEEVRIQKNKKIKESISSTHEKRKNQVCSVFKVKIQENKLNKKQKECLKMLFVEGKWIINDITNFSKQSSNNKIWNYKLPADNKITVLNKNKEKENREILFLGSQMKQSILSDIVSSIRTLHSLKKRGNKVGELKFRSECKSINLKQYKTTYRFCSKNKMKIQNVPGKIHINGTDQFLNNKELEFANAKLLNTVDGYFVSITCFKSKKEKEDFEKGKDLKEVGIDFGIKSNFVLSNGEKINFSIEESDRLKLLQAKLARQQKRSNNRKKTICKIRKKYSAINNKKNDFSNKFVHYLMNNFSKIYIQDEQINSWKDKFGKSIQHSVLGRAKSKLLRNRFEKVVLVDKSQPTSKTCSACFWKNNDLKLQDRVFECKNCKLKIDRDLNAARNMILFGKSINKSIPAERREFKPVDKNISFCEKQEAAGLKGPQQFTIIFS